MEVLLDTNFIISCVKKKIDFVTELEGMGFKVLLPREVLDELKDLRLNSDSATRTAVEVSMELIEKRALKKTRLANMPVDHGLIDMGKKGAYIATLDAVIKRQVPNRVVISEAGNSLVVERS